MAGGSCRLWAFGMGGLVLPGGAAAVAVLAARIDEARNKYLRVQMQGKCMVQLLQAHWGQTHGSNLFESPSTDVINKMSMVLQHFKGLMVSMDMLTC